MKNMVNIITGLEGAKNREVICLEKNNHCIFLNNDEIKKLKNHFAVAEAKGKSSAEEIIEAKKAVFDEIFKYSAQAHDVLVISIENYEAIVKAHLTSSPYEYKE